MRKVTVVACLFAAAGAVIADGVDLTGLQRVRVAAEPLWGEANCARMLVDLLTNRYGLKVELIEEAGKDEASTLFVGREAALASGLITQAELEAVKHDGYVLKARDGRIAVAGYRGRGTLYGGYRLQRALGLKLYPFRNGATVEAFRPLPDKTLGALDVRDKPALDLRCIRTYVNQGRWGGGSWLDLGDVRKAANPELFSRDADPKYLIKGDWPSSLHTAAYLIPRELYYDTHPEYFAIGSNGKRIARNTRYSRLAINMVHPDVKRISAQRTLQWMNMQPQRRFFYVASSDARLCKGEHSRAVDLQYHYMTDRLLRWVNHVAERVADKHPEKRVLTLAYIETVKPPVKVKPADNVWMMYCPWYWDSRNVPYADWDHPGNIVAKEEILDWLLCCPNQVGVFDYPGIPIAWVRGQADRIKFFARQGIRAVQCDGAPLTFEDLFHYVNTRLLWDPTLDTAALEQEFLLAFHGPAAGAAMQDYLRLHREYHGLIWQDPAVLARARALLDRAVEAARPDPEALHRTRHTVAAWMNGCLTRRRSALAAAAGDPASAVTEAEVATFAQQVRAHLLRNQRLMEAAKARGLSGYHGRRYEGNIRKLLKACGVAWDRPLQKEIWAAEEGEMTQTRGWIDEVMPQVKENLAKLVGPAEKKAPPKRQVTVLAVTAPADAKAWSAACSTPELASAPAYGRVSLPAGGALAGMKLSAPLTKLPVATLPINPKGTNEVQKGNFSFGRKFEEPVDVAGCEHFDVLLHASTAVPATLYVQTDAAGGGIRADVNLHPGVQIARISLASYARTWRDRGAWDGKVHGLAVQLWPQDNFWPYPAARDVEVTLVRVTAHNHDQEPADLPFRGRAVWLNHYRSNHSRKVPYGGDAVRFDQAKLGLGGGRYRAEGFRSKTTQRLRSPIFGIVVGPRPTGAQIGAAKLLQAYLAKIYGVQLPINPAGLKAGPDTGNVLVVGTDLALACGLVERRELERVGDEGFVLRARDGRIGIAANQRAGFIWAARAFLEHQGMDFLAAPDSTNGGDPARTADAYDDGMLHELAVHDWPFFATGHRHLPGGWRQARGVGKDWPKEGTAAERDWVQRVARQIKQAARRGTAPGGEVLVASHATGLCRYVAARLLWNPYLDTSELVRTYLGPQAEPDAANGEQPRRFTRW